MMALTVTTLRDRKLVGAWTADRRLWLAKDRQTVVEDGDPQAKFLLIGAGQTMPMARAVELGLAKQAPKVEDKQAPKPHDKSRGR